MFSRLRNSQAFHSIFGSGFARAYVLLVELILVAVSAHVLVPEDRGVYVAGIGLLKTVAVLSTFALAQVAVRRLATAADWSSQRGVELGNLIAGGAVFSVVANLLFHLVGLIRPEFRATYVEPFWVLVAVGLPIYLFEVYFYTFLTAAGGLKGANLSIVLGKTVCWVLVVVCGYGLAVLTTDMLVGFVVLGQLVVLLGYFYTSVQLFRTTSTSLKFSLGELIAAARSAIRLYPTIVGSIVFGGIDLLLIYNYVGPAGTSSYQIALQGIAALSVLPFAVAQFGYSTISKNGVLQGWLSYRKVVLVGLVCHVVLVIISLFCARAADSVLFDGAYADVYDVYLLLAIGSPGVYLSLAMAPVWIGHGFFLASSTLSILTALLVIPMTSIVVQSFGLVGGGYAFLFAQALSVLTNGYMIFYCEKNGSKRRSLLAAG